MNAALFAYVKINTQVFVFIWCKENCSAYLTDLYVLLQLLLFKGYKCSYLIVCQSSSVCLNDFERHFVANTVLFFTKEVASQRNKLPKLDLNAIWHMHSTPPSSNNRE